MFIVPTRAPPVLAATDAVTAPLEVPLLPPVTATQSAVLDAVHEQPFSVDTFTESAPPAAAAVPLVLLRLNVHDAAAWLSGARCEPTVMAADRADGTGLGATENGTTASP
jgi:hypothetical protein